MNCSECTKMDFKGLGVPFPPYFETSAGWICAGPQGPCSPAAGQAGSEFASSLPWWTQEPNLIFVNCFLSWFMGVISWSLQFFTYKYKHIVVRHKNEKQKEAAQCCLTCTQVNNDEVDSLSGEILIWQLPKMDSPEARQCHAYLSSTTFPQTSQIPSGIKEHPLLNWPLAFHWDHQQGSTWVLWVLVHCYE